MPDRLELRYRSKKWWPWGAFGSYCWGVGSGGIFVGFVIWYLMSHFGPSFTLREPKAKTEMKESFEEGKVEPGEFSKHKYTAKVIKYPPNPAGRDDPDYKLSLPYFRVSIQYFIKTPNEDLLKALMKTGVIEPGGVSIKTFAICFIKGDSYTWEEAWEKVKPVVADFIEKNPSP